MVVGIDGQPPQSVTKGPIVIDGHLLPSGAIGHHFADRDPDALPKRSDAACACANVPGVEQLVREVAPGQPVSWHPASPVDRQCQKKWWSQWIDKGIFSWLTFHFCCNCSQANLCRLVSGANQPQRVSDEYRSKVNPRFVSQWGRKQDAAVSHESDCSSERTKKLVNVYFLLLAKIRHAWKYGNTNPIPIKNNLYF
jgi:hypothetical protein